MQGDVSLEIWKVKPNVSCPGTSSSLLPWPLTERCKCHIGLVEIHVVGEI